MMAEVAPSSRDGARSPPPRQGNPPAATIPGLGPTELAVKQTARQNDEPQKRRPQRAQAPQGALVPARVAQIPIEPPTPDEVADKLSFRSAAQYKKVVAMADRFYQQARYAVERRAASVKKAERQAQVDHEETATNYQRQ